MDSPPGIAFGRPLRLASWRKLSVRQRFVLELAEFTAIEPDAPKSLSVFWHNAHIPMLGLLARVDCPGSFNVCLNVTELSDALPALAALVWCSGIVAVRDTDDTSIQRALCSVPLAIDFAGFDSDAEFEGKEPPPVLAARGQFEFTSGLVETPSGHAVVAMGMIPIHDHLFEWLYGDAEGIEQTGRVFIGAFLPPTFVEAAFLEGGLFYHRSTGLLPTFLGDPPWTSDDTVTSYTFSLPFLNGCGVGDLATAVESRHAELDARARMLRNLINRAEDLHMGRAGIAQRTQWDADKDEWERTQARLLEDVVADLALASGGVAGGGITIQRGALTVHVCSGVPHGGAWVQSIPELQQQIEKYAASSRAVELRQGPFAFATLTL
jgi:hypothetical protein